MPVETNTIRENQSVYDFCIWKYGSLDFLSKIIIDNGLNFDELIPVGSEIKTDSAIGNKAIKSQFKTQNIEVKAYYKTPSMLENALLWGDQSEPLLYGDETEFLTY